jgi:hypothetical protein
MSQAYRAADIPAYGLHSWIRYDRMSYLREKAGKLASRIVSEDGAFYDRIFKIKNADEFRAALNTRFNFPGWYRLKCPVRDLSDNHSHPTQTTFRSSCIDCCFLRHLDPQQNHKYTPLIEKAFSQVTTTSLTTSFHNETILCKLLNIGSFTLFYEIYCWVRDSLLDYNATLPPAQRPKYTPPKTKTPYRPHHQTRVSPATQNVARQPTPAQPALRQLLLPFRPVTPPRQPRLVHFPFQPP